MPQALPLLIDTDMLADDALAVLMGLGQPELDIVGISCVAGRDPVEAVVQHTRGLLSLARATDIPVAQGFAQPLLASPRSGRISGQASPWNRVFDQDVQELQEETARLDAYDFIRDVVIAHPGITILGLGPLTNLAVAVQGYLQLLRDNVRELVLMAGAFNVLGNSTPVAETNVWADPEAAKIVLQSGLNIRIVPLDVTTKTLFGENELNRLPNTRIGRFVDSLVRRTLPHQTAIRKLPGFPMHDPLALAAIVDPSLLTYSETFVDVETMPGISAGQTIADFRDVWHKPANASVAVDVDVERFNAAFIKSVNNLG